MQFTLSDKQRDLMKAGMFRSAWVHTPAEFNRLYRLANRGLVKRTFIANGKARYHVTDLGKKVYRK